MLAPVSFHYIKINYDIILKLIMVFKLIMWQLLLQKQKYTPLLLLKKQNKKEYISFTFDLFSNNGAMNN